MCVGSVCTHPSYNDKNPPTHSRVRTAFKAYSSADERGLPSSTHAQYNCLDSRLCCFFLAHALLLPARGQGARQSASPPDDENDVMQTVRGCGRPQYTLALS